MESIYLPKLLSSHNNKNKNNKLIIQNNVELGIYFGVNERRMTMLHNISAAVINVRLYNIIFLSANAQIIMS